jgi:hypothetical protein
VSDYPLWFGPGTGGPSESIAAADSSLAPYHHKPKKPKKAKKLKCKHGFVKVNGEYIACDVVTDESLSDGGNSVDELPPVEATMDCKSDGTCTATLPPILPNGLICDSTGTPAIDFTADPPFVVNTEVSRERFCTQAEVDALICGSTSDTIFEYAQAWFGCYADGYVCENLPNYGDSGGFDCTGEVTGTDYCAIPPLTGTAICEAPPG